MGSEGFIPEVRLQIEPFIAVPRKGHATARSFYALSLSFCFCEMGIVPLTSLSCLQDEMKRCLWKHFINCQVFALGVEMIRSLGPAYARGCFLPRLPLQPGAPRSPRRCPVLPLLFTFMRPLGPGTSSAGMLDRNLQNLTAWSGAFVCKLEAGKGGSRRVFLLLLGCMNLRASFTSLRKGDGPVRGWQGA